MSKKKEKNSILLPISLIIGLFALSRINKVDEYDLKRNRKIILEKADVL